MNEHGKINYVEFASANLPETKRFFTAAFDWSFEDFGPDYTAFSNEGLDGGFYYAELSASAAKGSALVIFYSNDLKNSGKNCGCWRGHFQRSVFFPRRTPF
jgi:predicted enzyme related to lactoylglutathione lyase